MKKRNTIKVYDGPSLLDGERIIALVTGLKTPSSNTKTADMLQSWIMRYDVAPHVAIKTGQDSSVCGNCALRPFLADQRPEHIKKPCYVLTFQAPRSTWKANRDLPVTPPDKIVDFIGGRQFRFGSYGDPAAVPMWVWNACKNGERRAGYSHQWDNPATQSIAADLGRLLMASVHTSTERARAKANGLRTFRVIQSLAEIEPGEVLCPASKEAGFKTTCDRCGLCDGKRGVDDKRKDIAIPFHG